MAFRDLREFVDAATLIGETKTIDGAHWNLEIGCLTELMAEQDGPLLLFDNIPGYPKGFRIATNVLATARRFALALGLSPDLPKLQILMAWRDKIRTLKPFPPIEVSSGPVTENVVKRNNVDLELFPAPKWHEHDGGRYIGTGDMVVTKDPDSGWVNVGTYRACVAGKNRLTLWIIDHKHGKQIARRYWERRRPCPVAIVLGCEPATWMAAPAALKAGSSEYDYAGGLRQSPVDVIRGRVTGLPIPAGAEIAIEGEVPPPTEETRVEGPFGEWPGYYAHGAKAEPVIRVKALYYRSDPILAGAPPLKPPIVTFGVPIGAAAIWNYLEKADVPDIRGVWCYVGGSAPGGGAPFIVVSLKQRYQGHAQQAGIAALGCRAGNYHGRFVVVVDEDIDPSDLGEVIWAISTRCDTSTLPRSRATRTCPYWSMASTAIQ